MPPVPAARLATKRPALLTIVIVTVVAVALAARFLLGSPAPSTPTTPAIRVDESDIADYLGNEACQSCHPKEFEAHKGSHHAQALKPMTRAELGEDLPPTGRINNTQYSFVEQDGRFYFEVDPPGQPDKHQMWPLDFTFGSGATGESFVSMLEGRNVVEMKMSYFPHEHLWRVTPGQQVDNPAAAGNLGNLEQSRHCLSCHVIAMSKNTFVPRREFYSVGCESCHGPGAKHVAAVQSGSKDLQMTDFSKLGATQVNEMCGRCHRTAQDVEASPLKSMMTFRFQPYGLMKSRCFLESGDRLSCQTCHDPHTNVSTDNSSYVRACLSCHSGAHAPGQGKVCPKSPTGNCIPCHMPKRDVLSVIHQHYGFSMTEHMIGIDRNGSTAPR